MPKWNVDSTAKGGTWFILPVRFKKQKVNFKSIIVMIKKLLLVLLVSLFAVGNVNAQKQKRSMKPKKKEQIEQPYCAEPAFDPCNDTLNVDTLGAKMFETVEGLKPSFPGDLSNL